MENTEKKTAEIETANAENIPAPVADFAALEKLAENAHYLNHFGEYQKGSATREIEAQLKEAQENLNFGLARCATDKQREDLRAKFETYKRKIISYYLDYYKNEAACPSVLICGAGNFPTAKKNKQNARRDSLMADWKALESLKDSLRGGYSMAISSDDPQAVEALTAKLEQLKKAHAFKVAANAYFRKHKTFKGMEGLTDEAAERLDSDARNAAARMGGRCEPFPAWSLSNENAEIKRLEKRLKELQEAKENILTGWNFDGGRVEIDAENNRIGVYFDERTTGADLESLYKENKDLYLPRLLWSPRFQRWQCQNSAQNLRRLQNSKTFAPSDDESKKAIEEAEKAKQEKRAQEQEAEKKAKEEKEAKAAAAFKERAEALQKKQDELKKCGFLLKGAQLAYCNNNIAAYMKAGHGLRRKIIVSESVYLTVEIFYKERYLGRGESENLIVAYLKEWEAQETGTAKSGCGYMVAEIDIKALEQGEKRQIKTLQALAERYNKEKDDARIIALYNAYKSGVVPHGQKYFDDGNHLEPKAARAFLESWKPAEGQEQQEKPKTEEQQQEQERPTTPPYLSIKGEQLYLI